MSGPIKCVIYAAANAVENMQPIRGSETWRGFYDVIKSVLVQLMVDRLRNPAQKAKSVAERLSPNRDLARPSKHSIFE